MALLNAMPPAQAAVLAGGGTAANSSASTSSPGKKYICTDHHFTDVSGNRKYPAFLSCIKKVSKCSEVTF